jgi:erythromycin esterase-like protein
MFGGRAQSWNMRDEHMAATLDELIGFLEVDRRNPKIVVWAHNSHLGDARATEMSRRGELNVGQLVREHWGHAALSVGFSTYTGTVTAATDWDQPAERKIVRPALEESYEALFHETGLPNLYMGLRANTPAVLGLRQPRLERAIGVIYRPETERLSHYFHARLPHQFDAILHYDVTRAVEPLERTGLWERGELPETYPSTL